MSRVVAAALAAVFFSAVPAFAQDRIPARKISGWQEEQHWGGDDLKATWNGRETKVEFSKRADITCFLSEPVEFEKRIRPQLVVKAQYSDEVKLELFGKTPGDVCGQLIDIGEQDGYALLRYELLNARRQFSQLTFRTGTKGKGVVIIGGMQLVEGPIEYKRTPPNELYTPAKEHKSDLKPLEPGADAKAWEARREELRKLWMTALGAFPKDRPPLNVQELSSEEFEDYTRKRVRFTAEGPDTIDAWVLIPKPLDLGKGPFPAVVCLHPTTDQRGDEMVGLSGRGNVAHAIHLVKEGYVTLAYDCYIMKADTPEGRKIKEQVKALADRVPEWTGLGKMTWDASRAVDYLETLAFVDKARIGVIGHSLGGKQALFAAALEPRFACAVSSEGGVGLTFSNWTDPWYLGEKMKARIGELENHQVLALCAPRPILVLGGDSADGDKSRTFIDAAGAAFRLLGREDAAALYNHKAGHSYPYSARWEAHRWLAKFLKK